MTNNQMLQAIFDTVSSLRNEIKDLRNEMNDKFKKVDENFKKVNQRLNKIGESVAYLEDDTPTRKEFENLENRVNKLINN
ncbi:MAG TPA: hypothetical protein VG895_01325 [Patescibacteria group bacterium]|nr:hypothetical protein [Patescibacteria group bacterium]